MVASVELETKIEWLIGPTYRRQIADRDPARQIRHAGDCLDVVRREHRLYRKPDRVAGDDGRRQGRPQGVRRETQALVDGQVAWLQFLSEPWRGPKLHQ